jgi:hypothetical protein
MRGLLLLSNALGAALSAGALLVSQSSQSLGACRFDPLESLLCKSIGQSKFVVAVRTRQARIGSENESGS